MRVRSTAAVTSALAAALLLTACGGGDADADSASGATTLGVKSTQITVAATGATAGPGADGQELANGDTVTTNGTGFGIVNYADGSLTRIDKNAVFTLDEMGTSATQPQVKATLKQGQAWNRVQKITDTNGQYEITTPYGTVAVRGTTFNIDCTQPANACTITVIEGTIELTPTNGTPTTINAPTTAVLTAGDATPIKYVTAADNPWIATNLVLDAEGATTTPGEELSPAQVLLASPEGDWTIRATLVAETNTKQETGQASPPGSVTISDVTCSSPGNCSATWNGESGSRAMSSQNGVWTWERQDVDQPCTDDSGEVLDTGTGTTTWTGVSIKAESGAGSGTVTTEMRATALQVFDPTAACPEVGTQRFDIILTRP